jgi:quinohemoprotein ethanol dehydrogenase
MAPPAAEAAPPTPGFLIAWDPVARKPRWKVQYPAIWNSGLLSTAGNLVFQGTSDGRFVAYSADRGEKLWEVAVGTGVIASPITYLIDGVQYVSVLAGWGGAAPLVGLEAKHGPVAVPGRLLTFALNGKAPMPPVTLQKVELQPVAFEAKPETLQAGMALYAQWCSVCHGIAAVGGGVIPDLRYSAPAVYASYPQIVLEGAMANSGMPSLKRWVKPEELEAIRLFVLSQRAKLIR